MNILPRLAQNLISREQNGGTAAMRARGMKILNNCAEFAQLFFLQYLCTRNGAEVYFEPLQT